MDMKTTLVILAVFIAEIYALQTGYTAGRAVTQFNRRKTTADLHFSSPPTTRRTYASLEDKIITEIRSMVEAIEDNCLFEYEYGYCNAFTNNVTRAQTVPDICLAMMYYSRCKLVICLYQSALLKQLLSDSMIIPYCSTAYFVSDDSTSLSVAKNLSDMRKLCQFKPGMDCDLEFTDFLKSVGSYSRCYNQSYYVMCLEQKCVNQSLDLRQKINAVKNDVKCTRYPLPSQYVLVTRVPPNDRSRPPQELPFDAHAVTRNPYPDSPTTTLSGGVSKLLHISAVAVLMTATMTVLMTPVVKYL